MAWKPSRAAIAAITAGVVVAGVGAGVLLQPGKDRDPPVARGPGVSIAVVAPREPIPEPGAIMDVGDLTDGYTHRDYVQPTVDYRPADAVMDDYPPVREAPERVERPREPVPEPALPVLVERRERPSRWPFGFDPYRPDSTTERRERRAQRDEARRYERERMADRFDEREAYPEPRDDRVQEDWRNDERRDRERQWYSSDGRPVPGPG